MKRLLDNLLIDLIAAALMIGMLATGYILRFPLPPGSNRDLTLWGLTRHQWGDVHFWISLGLMAVILLHLCLHWQWIAISVKRRLSRRKAAPGSALASGLMTFLVLVAVLFLFGWAAQSGSKRSQNQGRGYARRLDKREGTKPPTWVAQFLKPPRRMAKRSSSGGTFIPSLTDPAYPVTGRKSSGAISVWIAERTSLVRAVAHRSLCRARAPRVH
jgi:hypothetical protein